MIRNCNNCKENNICSLKHVINKNFCLFFQPTGMKELTPKQTADYLISEVKRTDMLSTKTWIPLKQSELNEKLPKKIIQNKNATVLFWEDNSKTIVKCSEDDNYDAEKGFLMAYFEKQSGMSKTQAKKYLKKNVVKEEVK